MNFVSLFAGIGGIDLGLERAGHTCIGQVEIDEWCNKVLEKHWPDTPRIRDVRDYKGHEFGPADMLTAGYPCQPFSVAGKREGLNDPRHVWPEVDRLIRALRPRLVLLENVPGHLSLGFGQVLGDLAESGYDAEWMCIPAAAFGAPHLRFRLFILAYPAGEYGDVAHPSSQRRAEARQSQRPQRPSRSGPEMAHANEQGPQGRYFSSERTRELTTGQGRATLGGNWESEPNVGRVAHGIPRRVDRLRGLGNAVVPQVAEFIGRLVMAEALEEMKEWPSQEEIDKDKLLDELVLEASLKPHEGEVK